MIVDIILSSLAIAGAAMIWRELLNDNNQNLRKKILATIPFPLNKALTCGFCFTYWLSLFFVLIFDPLQSWIPTARIRIPFHFTVEIVLSWMVLGTIALFIRFTIVAIHEHVHLQMERMGNIAPRH